VPKSGDGLRVGQKGVVVGLMEALAVADRRGMGAQQIAVDQVVVLLVEGNPGADPVAEAPEQGDGIAGEIGDDAAVFPAAMGILERLRHVPVIKGRDRFDAMRQQGIDQTVIEGQSRLVDGVPAIGQHARPTDREAVGLQAQFGHQGDILAEPVVMIDGHVAGAALEGAARLLAERIPDRGTFPVLVPGSFDLIGGGGGAPEEIPGKGGQAVVMHGASFASVNGQDRAPLPFWPDSSGRVGVLPWHGAKWLDFWPPPRHFPLFHWVDKICCRARRSTASRPWCIWRAARAKGRF
jgi:hypothetical protein